MASVCMSQTNYQQQHHFQLMNGNIMLLQQQHQQQPQLQTKQYQKQQAIAPAKILGNSNLQNIQSNPVGLAGMLPKKKYTYMNVPYGEQLPSVARRNARERNRVKQVNNGFCNLRQHLPQTVINSLSNGGRGASKKLSKVDTLRIAVEYIRGLQDMLGDTDSKSTTANNLEFNLDETSNDGSNYGNSSIGSPVDVAQYQLNMRSYNSEDSASPTPSYSDSDISIGGINYLQPLKQEQQTQEQPQQQQQQPQQQQQTQHALQFKFESFDDYSTLANDDEQLDDDKLLDYITLWQEQ